LAVAAAPFASAAAEEFDYPWKLGLITDEASPDLEEVLRTFYPKYGLRWAELRNVKLAGKSAYVYRDATTEQLKEIRRQLDGAGVKLSVLDTAIYKIVLPGTQPVGPPDSGLAPKPGDYERQLEDLKRAAEAVHLLGSDQLRVFTFRRVADPASVFDRVVEEMNKAITVAKASDVTLLMENEFSCNVATGTESRKLFDAIPDRRLMHNWDPGNCIEAGEQPFPKAWDQLDHSRISHLHLKDAEGKKWKPIGAGEIDFVGQFKALKDMRYKGTLSLETHYRNAQHDIYASTVESMDGLVGVLKKV
jgi:L-ribulose-5-phosphate 3-epimerase